MEAGRNMHTAQAIPVIIVSAQVFGCGLDPLGGGSLAEALFAVESSTRTGSQAKYCWC
jgi:hypothetical protein